MVDTRRALSAPWVAAAIAAAVLIALVVTYFVALRPDERAAAATRAGVRAQIVGDLTPAESAAMTAAGTEVLNLVTFSRAHFAADYQRAIDGTTGSLRSDVIGKKSTTLSAMTSGKFDLAGQVTHKALEGPIGGKTKGYVILVTINGYRSTQKNFPTPQNLSVSEVLVKGKWLAADVANIGVNG